MKAFSILFVFSFQDGKLWNPNKESKICAQHFIYGKPSFDRTKVDYVPTVFDDYQHGKHQEKEFEEKYPIPNKLPTHERSEDLATKTISENLPTEPKLENLSKKKAKLENLPQNPLLSNNFVKKISDDSQMEGLKVS